MPVQDEMLAETVEQMDTIEPIISAMIVAWLAGDEREFRRLFDLESGDSPEVQAFMRRLLEDRNVGMADKIAGYLQMPGTTFVLVGAAHLTGPEGIVALLEARGSEGSQNQLQRYDLRNTWNFEGKRAIVLGGTSGIGLAVSKQLAAAGAVVTAASRTANRAVAENVAVRPVDVLDRSALERLFKDLAPFDILVNAATGGSRATGPFLSMDLDGFEGSFRKLWGYVNSVRLGAPLMSERGSIVLISGSPARKAMPGMSAISTVGNAVEGFVRAVAPELAPRRINVVAPGVIDTPMFAASGEQREAFLKQATSRNLIPRAGTADEVAEAVLLLLRNEFMTGTTIDVDGGALLP